MHSWVNAALDGRPGERERPPGDWDELLPWADEQRSKMLAGLEDPEAPAWLPFTRYPQVAASWARRQAHEAAIHRLDVEHALAAEPSLEFDPEFAADGVDELIAWLVPTRGEWEASAFSGVVVLHATDVDSGWTVRLSSGLPPEVTAGVEPGDVTITGPADAVYRRVWRRPSAAVVTGSTELLEPLAGP